MYKENNKIVKKLFLDIVFSFEQTCNGISIVYAREVALYIDYTRR